MIKKFLISLGIACTAMVAFFTVTALAGQVDISITSSDGYGCEALMDDDAFSWDYYRTDTFLTITSSEQITALYIKWGTVPGGWILNDGGKDYTYGADGYLQELVTLPTPANEVKITIKTDRTYIVDIYAFSGDIPDWVHVWEPPYDKADILYVSTHSDDDVLFFGGLIPTYIDRDVKVQAAYYVDHSMDGESGKEIYRNHELLDCIWHMGLRHYPKMGEFCDAYSQSLEGAMANQSIDEAIEYIVRIIRMYKPQVLISQDFDGEYGHGQHMLVAEATATAIQISADASQYPESAAAYGVWDVPKTYYHLYAENQIVIDDNVPLEKYGGRTALEVAKEAYTYHLSQQWMVFRVSDDYEYACNKFGLYRTTVGADTTNDVMENLTPYPDSEPAETTTAAEAGGDTQPQETAAESAGTAVDVQTQEAQAEQPTTQAQPASTKGNTSDKILLIVLIVLAVILAVLIIVVIVRIAEVNKKKKRRQAAAAAKRQLPREQVPARRQTPENQARTAGRTQTRTQAPENNSRQSSSRSRVTQVDFDRDFENWRR